MWNHGSVHMTDKSNTGFLAQVFQHKSNTTFSLWKYTDLSLLALQRGISAVKISLIRITISGKTKFSRQSEKLQPKNMYCGLLLKNDAVWRIQTEKCLCKSSMTQPSTSSIQLQKTAAIPSAEQGEALLHNVLGLEKTSRSWNKVTYFFFLEDSKNYEKLSVRVLEFGFRISMNWF